MPMQSTKFLSYFIRRYGRKIVIIIGTLGMSKTLKKKIYHKFSHQQVVAFLEFYVLSQQIMFNLQFLNFSMPYSVPQLLHLHLLSVCKLYKIFDTTLISDVKAWSWWRLAIEQFPVLYLTASMRLAAFSWDLLQCCLKIINQFYSSRIFPRSSSFPILAFFHKVSIMMLWIWLKAFMNFSMKRHTMVIFKRTTRRSDKNFMEGMQNEWHCNESANTRFLTWENWNKRWRIESYKIKQCQKQLERKDIDEGINANC